MCNILKKLKLFFLYDLFLIAMWLTSPLIMILLAFLHADLPWLFLGYFSVLFSVVHLIAGILCGCKTRKKYCLRFRETLLLTLVILIVQWVSIGPPCLLVFHNLQLWLGRATFLPALFFAAAFFFSAVLTGPYLSKINFFLELLPGLLIVSSLFLICYCRPEWLFFSLVSLPSRNIQTFQYALWLLYPYVISVLLGRRMKKDHPAARRRQTTVAAVVAFCVTLAVYYVAAGFRFQYWLQLQDLISTADYLSFALFPAVSFSVFFFLALWLTQPRAVEHHADESNETQAFPMD